MVPDMSTCSERPIILELLLLLAGETLTGRTAVTAMKNKTVIVQGSEMDKRCYRALRVSIPQRDLGRNYCSGTQTAND